MSSNAPCDSLETIRERIAAALRCGAQDGQAQVVLELRDCETLLNVFEQWFGCR